MKKVEVVFSKNNHLQFANKFKKIAKNCVPISKNESQDLKEKSPFANFQLVKGEHPKNSVFTGFFERPYEESNLKFSLRRTVLYPFNYKDLYEIVD